MKLEDFYDEMKTESKAKPVERRVAGFLPPAPEGGPILFPSTGPDGVKRLMVSTEDGRVVPADQWEMWEGAWD